MSRPVERLLERLEKVKRTSNGWEACCPAHEDKNPSLSIKVGDDGKVVLHCFAGCEPEDVVAAVGLRIEDLFESSDCLAQGKRGGSPRSGKQRPGNGLTLEQYAQAKRLPVDFLQDQGITEITYLKSPAVRIPYRDSHGTEVSVRFRLAQKGPDRFHWRKGSKARPYGMWKLADAKAFGSIVLVEGESDAQTLWFHKIPALGLPGASTWREDYVPLFEGIEKIYLVIEPDQGGKTLLDLISKSALSDRVFLLDLGEHKDVSEAHLAGQFGEAWAQAIKSAIPLSKKLSEQQAAERERLWSKCSDLARSPRILDRFARDIRRMGLVGEEKNAKILYLALTSRVLDKPVSVAVKGPSAAGKSFSTEQVLEFFPPSAYYALSASSERALAYSEEPLKNRFLVLYEAAGMGGDFASYLLRSLLSEGRLRYETVEKTSEGLQARLIEREGPTGLIVTTTAVSLHAENETRLFTLTVTDSREQTKAIMKSLAEETKEPIDLAPWQALQEWIALAEHRVEIPYAKALADLIPPAGVRLRRDFRALLSLIRAHALLHQVTRDKDAEGRIRASFDDYQVVRELVLDLLAEGLELSVSDAVRETVEAVEKLREDHDSGVKISALKNALRLDRSAAYRRAKQALARGFLKNLEERKNQALRLVVGEEPLPEKQEILPSVEQIEACCTGARDSEGYTTPPPPIGLSKEADRQGTVRGLL